MSVKIAKSILRQAAKENLLQAKDVPLDDDSDLEEWIEAQMWQAEYREFVLDEAKGQRLSKK